MEIIQNQAKKNAAQNIGKIFQICFFLLYRSAANFIQPKLLKSRDFFRIIFFVSKRCFFQTFISFTYTSRSDDYDVDKYIEKQSSVESKERFSIGPTQFNSS